jgi:hypothetical protein
MKKYFSIFAFLFLLQVPGVAATQIKIVSNPISQGVLPSNGVSIPFLQIHLTPAERVSLESVTVRQTGLSSHHDVKNLRIVSEWGNSYRASVMPGGAAHIRFPRDFSLPGDRTTTLTLLANLSTKNGRTIGFQVEAVNINGISHEAAIKDYQNYPEYSTTSYQIPKVKIQNRTSYATLFPGRENRLARFTLNAPSRSASYISQLRLRNYGTAHLDRTFDNLELRQNQRTIATTRNISRNYVHFFPQISLHKGETATLEVWGIPRYTRSGETIALELEHADENFQSYARHTRYQNPVHYSRNNSRYHTIRPGSFSLSRDNYYPYRDTYAPGSRDVIFLSETISHKSHIYIPRIKVFIDRDSQVQDHNQNGRSDADDFHQVFGDLRLYLDNQYIDNASFEEKNGEIFLEFDLDQPLRQGKILVSGRISHKAQSGEKLKLYLDHNRSFPESELY